MADEGIKSINRILAREITAEELASVSGGTCNSYSDPHLSGYVSSGPSNPSDPHQPTLDPVLDPGDCVDWYT
jgi:hypothetical protein